MSTKFNKRQLPDSTVYNDEETTFQAKVLLPIATPTDDKEAITFKFYKDKREEIDTEISLLKNPDRITVNAGYTLLGQDLTFNPDWKVVIDAVEYTNTAQVILNFPLASAGYSRLDLVAFTKDSTFVRVAGVESLTTPVAPSTPPDTVYITVVFVSDVSVNEPISSVHNPVTLGTANGLSLSNQQLSLGLASSGVTGALSGTDWNTFNNKENAFSKNTAFNKNFGLNSGDVVGANTLLNQYSTTPVDWTATAFYSGQVVFYAGKQWIANMDTVAGDVPAVSSKWEKITFEALANKTKPVDQTIIDGSTNAVSSNAVFDGLALKSNIGHTHVASQITDLSKASVGLGNVDNTSDLSKPLSTATINALATKFPTPIGLTTNYLPKWNGSGFGNSQIFDNGANVGIGTTTPNVKFDVAGVIRSSFIDSYPSIEAFNQGTVGFPLFQLRNIKNSVEKFWNIENGRTINGDLGFYNEGGQRITFTTNGRVLINKTNDDLTNQLQVAGTISASPATTANQVPTWGQVQAAARPYKVYTALLSQTATNAPTATVLENTLGGTVVWSYVSIGQYRGTLTGAFLANKTVVFLTNVYGEYFLTGGRENDNSVIIGTQAPNGGSTNGDLSNSSIEIRVYL